MTQSDDFGHVGFEVRGTASTCEVRVEELGLDFKIRYGDLRWLETLN